MPVRDAIKDKLLEQGWEELKPHIFRHPKPLITQLWVQVIKPLADGEIADPRLHYQGRTKIETSILDLPLDTSQGNENLRYNALPYPWFDDSGYVYLEWCDDAEYSIPTPEGGTLFVSTRTPMEEPNGQMSVGGGMCLGTLDRHRQLSMTRVLDLIRTQRAILNAAPSHRWMQFEDGVYRNVEVSLTPTIIRRRFYRMVRGYIPNINFRNINMKRWAERAMANLLDTNMF